MCLVDYHSAMVPTILWAAAVGLLLIAGVTLLIVRDRRGAAGYQRL